MDLLTIITILLCISAVFSYLNERFIKLPDTIGIVTISVVVSVLILIAGKTGNGLSKTIVTFASGINFSKVLLDVMLGLLLFASALHLDYQKLKEQRWPVILLSTLGVVISTFVFGGLIYLILMLLPFNIPFIYCLVFGALISPTDPIAVSAILKKSKISPRLNTIILGESLFNDAVSLVLFVTLLAIAERSGATLTIGAIERLFAQQVLGGIGIGLIAGFLGYRMIRSVKNFQTMLLISVALVMAISFIAHQFQASIPLSAVTAGLIIGNKSLDKKHIVNKFLSRIWQLLDDVLNTILFVMIGLQLVLMPFVDNYWLIGLLSIIVILIARLVSVSFPAVFLLRKVSIRSLSILTWAGVRGGISVAMALSLPDSPYREIILSSCYFIVIFSIIIQGLTLNRLVTKLSRN
ncbi:MAG: cation:proton antiporter [Ginsengibacter sp.]